MSSFDLNDIKYLRSKFGLVGQSASFITTLELLLQSAPTDLSVLITGETGTGKEVFASALHGLSKRKRFPFVSVNCGAIPENLLESELFGYEKGAFTGANEQRKGYFESAHNGSIFLDEIGEMPIATQVKLLRVLESGEFSRLGSPKLHKVDVRIIAATNRNLEEGVRSGIFRQDLYYRLRSVHIELPSLRERIEDIDMLFGFFADTAAKKAGFEYQGIELDALDYLKSQPWDGNIRELKHFAETMITLEKSGFVTLDMVLKYLRPKLPPHTSINIPAMHSLAVIPQNNRQTMPDSEMSLVFRSLLQLQSDVHDLKQMLNIALNELDTLKINQRDQMRNHNLSELENNNNKSNSLSFDTLNIAEVEKKIIEEALKRTLGNKRSAAKELGVSERTLYRKIADYGLE